MRAIAARLRPRWDAALLRGAVLAGLTVRNLPEAVGALLVSYGLGLAWNPLGYMAAGGFLLLMGRKLS
ncbi:hypothetical protein K1W54_38125 [Micromonospora sp. CPCC 205371]|nr:hypothetical protein [Micromonospora sp. CPCC 205371]